MKKLNLLLAVFIGLIILSCSNDSENPDAEKDPIIGKWNIVSIELNGAISTLHECHLQQTTTYKENGDLIEYSWDDRENPCVFNTGTVQYRLENEILTFINIYEAINGVPFEKSNEIITLNQTTLVIKEIGDNHYGQYPENQQPITTFIKVE